MVGSGAGLRSFAVVVALAAPGAFLATGCAGSAAKSAKALDAFVQGDADALEQAVDRADKAVDKHPEDASAWELRGRVHLAWAENPPPSVDRLPARDPAGVALESFEKALGLGASGGLHAGLADDVPRLEALLVSRLTNAVEARAWDEAAPLVGVAGRARALDTKVRGEHPERVEVYERLAVLFCASTHDARGAGTHYQAFVAATGADDATLALLVGRTLAETDPPAALAFVGPLSRARGADEGLLRLEVQLLVEAKRSTDAIERIGAALPARQGSVGSQLLAGDLYEAAGAEQLALDRWEQAVAIDPRDASARTALGRGLITAAVAARTEIAARAEELDQRRPPKDLVQLAAKEPGLWVKAEEHLVAATKADPGSRAAAEALVSLYEARIGEGDADPGTPLAAAIEDQRHKLAAAKAKLAALGGGG